jgi:hypothetical protein
VSPVGLGRPSIGTRGAARNLVGLVPRPITRAMRWSM